MGRALGIDTSNYTTSAALYDGKAVAQAKRLLPVKAGTVGLRQSDAVFAHVKQLGDVLEQAWEGADPLDAVGVSVSPRDEAGSYMPCFLVGELVGRSVAQAAGAPLYRFSHQAGHVAAALYATDSLRWRFAPFLAFHVSGGTTECLHVRPDAQRILRIDKVSGTLDLNAGQAVDRVGALLGLPFPAGPALEELAAQSRARFSVRPTLRGMDCCLSGLENQCHGRLERGESREDVAAYCLEYLAATLSEMTRLAREAYLGLPLLYAGGVMSNQLIRGVLEERYGGRFAPPAFSADNAAGIAVLAALQREREGGTPCLP